MPDQINSPYIRPRAIAPNEEVRVYGSFWLAVKGPIYLEISIDNGENWVHFYHNNWSDDFSFHTVPSNSLIRRRPGTPVIGIAQASFGTDNRFGSSQPQS
jgi:hypothetical protein